MKEVFHIFGLGKSVSNHIGQTFNGEKIYINNYITLASYFGNHASYCWTDAALNRSADLEAFAVAGGYKLYTTRNVEGFGIKKDRIETGPFLLGDQKPKEMRDNWNTVAALILHLIHARILIIKSIFKKQVEINLYGFDGYGDYCFEFTHRDNISFDQTQAFLKRDTDNINKYLNKYLFTICPEGGFDIINHSKDSKITAFKKC